MRLESPPDFLELRVTELVPDGHPGAGDIRVEARVSVDGFAGAAPFWVEAEVMRAFSSALNQMSASLQGEATLRSISPGGFVLSVSPGSPRGHVLVRIGLGKRLPHQCMLQAEFEVELPEFVSLLAWSRSPCVNA